MRIGFDARSLSAQVMRGWDRYLVGLARELSRRGIEITLFHRAREPLNLNHVRDLDCGVVGLDDRGGMHWEQVALPLALWRRKIDLFHAPSEHGVPLGALCPVVLTLHSVTAHSYRELIARGALQGHLSDYLDPELLIQKKWAWCYWRAQIARANHILCPSDFCRDEIIRCVGVSPQRVTATYLAVHEQFRRQSSAPDVRARALKQFGIEKPYLLYVGGFETHKNVGGLIEVFAKVRVVRPDLALVIVGSKALPPRLVASAQRLGLRTGVDVIFQTDVTDALTDLYDQAEMLVTLSWRETFCLPALEAMSRGIPVVASAWGAAPEIIGGAGRLVDPRDHEAAKKAILDLLGREDRVEFSIELRARAARFNWSATAIQTLNIYHSLVCRKSISAETSAIG